MTVDRFGLLLTIAAMLGIVGSAVSGRVIHRASTRRVMQMAAVVMVLVLPVVGALNRLHGLWSLGWLSGGFGAVAANAVGLDPFGHLLMVAAVMALALLLVTRNLLPEDETGHADAEPTVAASSKPVSRAPVTLLVFAGMFAVMLEVTGGDWATFRLTDDFGAPAAVGSLAFVAFSVGMTVMRFVGDAAQLRLGRPRLHRSSTVVAALGFAAASLVESEAVAILGFFLVGVGVATLIPKLDDDAARFRTRGGTGLGAMTAGMRVAFLITPVAVGALAGRLSVSAAIAIVTLPAIIGLAVTTEKADRIRRPQTPGVSRAPPPSPNWGQNRPPECRF